MTPTRQGNACTRNLFFVKISPHNVAKDGFDKTGNKDILDTVGDALLKIAEEAKPQPELLHNAPHDTHFGRIDEVKAARELALCCWLLENYDVNA